MHEEQVDVVIIGSGPAGEGAAMQATKAGLDVRVVERFDSVGGGCTHWGTIPSKSLRHAIQELTRIKESPFLKGIPASKLRIQMPELVARARSVIDAQVDMRASFYARNDVEIVQGHARFVEPHLIAVDRNDGGVTHLRTRHVVLAVGSRPWRPPGVDFDHPCIFDADTILGLTRTPRTLAVYGAGVIGSEYTSMFRSLGVKVNLLNTRERLLSYLDDEISDALAYHMRDQGVLIRHSEAYERIDTSGDDAVVVHLKSGKQIRCDAFLWANGRTGNTDRLGLEQVGLVPDQRGNLPVNTRYQTTLPHVYAVGDVSGPPALAGAAYDQGRFAARHILDPSSDRRLVEHIPTGIYTTPEIACIGKTEAELTAERVPYEVGRSQFRHLARAQISNQSTGVLKILFHTETLEILGIHCFGSQATEIIHIGQAIFSQSGKSNTLQYFVDTTFNYPTMAEAYRVAALNGLNRLF